MSALAKKLVVGGAIVAILVGVIVAAGRLVGSDADAPSQASTTVKIELRGKPPAAITMNGKAIGKTPTVIVVPRGTTPLEFEATFTIEKYGMARPAKKIEIWRQVKQVVPDAEQAIDFAQVEATMVSESVAPP